MDRSKSDDDEELHAFLEQTGETRDVSQSTNANRQKAARYVRWAVEILMAITIAVLLARPVANDGRTKASPVPRCTFSSCITCKPDRVANNGNVKLQFNERRTHSPKIQSMCAGTCSSTRTIPFIHSITGFH